MYSFDAIVQNKVLVAAVLAWFLAQSIKIVIVLCKTKKFSKERIMGAGGMPSSHSATVTAVTTAVAILQGFGSPLFGVCIMFSFIVMYDAAGVRYQAGNQAKVINEMAELLEIITNKDLSFEGKLIELLGHTRLEVFVGALLGCIIGIVTTM